MAATPKPTWLDRFTMIGDTIPQTRSAGGGGGSNRVYVDTSGTPTYPTDTMFVGFQEPATSGVANRPHWALAQSVSWMYEKVMATPHVETGVSAGGETYFSMTEVIYLGVSAATGSDINKVADILDVNWDELQDGGTSIAASDFRIEDQPDNPGTWITAYPVGGLPSIGAGDTIATASDSGSGAVITMTSGLSGSIKAASLFNYDHWLREIRDGGTPSEAFATITTFTSTSSFKVNRAVVALGWAVDDTLYITHFVYNPRLYLTNTLTSAGVTWRVASGSHSTLGRLPENAITSLKVRTAEEVPFEVEDFILAGLDGAYDQKGFGTAGGGRTVIVDSGAIQAKMDVDGAIGFQSIIDYADTHDGAIGAAYIPSQLSTQTHLRSGAIVASAVNPNDAAGTDWPSQAACSGNASGRITLTSDNFASGGSSDHNLYEGLDLVQIFTTGDAPYTVAGSPDGIYILKSVFDNTNADVVALDGSTPDLTTGGGALKCTLLRPSFVGHSGNIGFHGGVTTNRHRASIFTNYHTPTAPVIGSAAEFNSYWDYTTTAAGILTVSFAGNIDRSAPVAWTSFDESTYDTGSFAPTRTLSTVGNLTYNAVRERLEPDTANVLYWGHEFFPTSTIISKFYIDKSTNRIMRNIFGPYGETGGLSSNGSTPYDASYELGAWWNDGSDSFAFRAYEYTSGKYAYGMWGYFYDGIDNPTWAVIKESPTSPTTPTTTITDTTIAHRHELHETCNYGYSSARTIKKRINLALGQEIGTGWTPNNLSDAGGTGLVWQTTAGTAQTIYFPLEIPHGAVLSSVLLRYYISAIAGTDGELIVLRVDADNADNTDIGDVVNMGTGEALDTASTNDYTYTAGSNNTIDIENYIYYIRIVSRADGATPTQMILHMQATYTYADIFPQ
jgi:hypothetical protein